MDTLLMLPIQRRVVDTNTLLSKVESTLMVLKTLDINTNSQIQQKIQTVNWMEKESTHLNLKKVATKQTMQQLELKLRPNKLDTNIPLIRVMVSTVMVLRLLQVVVMTMTLLFFLMESTLKVSGLGFGENTQNITAIPTVPQYIYLIPIIKL